MDYKKICNDIINIGADKTCCIDVGEIVFNTDFRKSCEENRCGHYNKNYTCPPYAGTAESLIEKAKGYSKAVVVVCSEKIAGYEDKLGIKRAENRIADIALLADEYAKKADLDYMIIGGSSCKKCNPCGMATGKPCPLPEKAFISLSAFCVDISKISQSCGVDMVWDGSEVSYFAMMLIK